MSRDPRDTLVVVGGRPVAHVDAAGIRAAALRLADAAEDLRVATAACAAARSALDRDLWSPPPLGAPDPTRTGRVRWARALTDDAAVALAARAETCASLQHRLLLAAGLYEHAESTAERALGAVVTVGSGAAGAVITGWVNDPLQGLPLRWSGVLGLGLLAALSDDPDAPREPPVAVAPDAEPSGDGGLGGSVLRGTAPFVDEALRGAGFGVALAAPVAAHGDLSVTGGARVLSTAVRSALPDVEVRVEPLDAGRFTGGVPAWQGTAAGSVAEALARTADLYPHGSSIPGRPAPGPPPGTIGVERVVHGDGTVSWTVLVPGTQELLSAENPFDGATDLDLMAGRAADVMVAVEEALGHAGAARDEPVVLVGHSLGGIAAASLAASPSFRAKHRVGGVVTAGAPTATFRTPSGVPALHLENTQELVSPLDGRSTAENPATPDRVTVGRDLAASDDPRDRAASGSVAQAHGVPTHLRTLEHAQAVGNVQVAGVVGPIEELLAGTGAGTTFYTVRRASPGR
ncbi:hypothetical protein BCE75_11122 [Isoptericola sp. CG 20/1183]|uniref:PGAP1-like protein n=1 Tax=Isoptericola halotolerans TaxID=300560 RepID=A0ABX5EL74_9MICO|nr:MULTISPECIES: hypothetical protein [Isoptericola]PRZ04101.1 hypothetical protein BCE75_11122 [Isoptericola sp. CG 20/1183]PRZ10074.1 hypothetical protein BCL65_101212 [Isoptericola halotolerans]